MTAQAATRAAEGEGAVYSPGGRMVEGFLRQVMTSSSDDDSVEGLEIVRGEPAWSPTRRQQGGGGVGERGHSGSNGTSHGLRVSVWPREEARQSRQGERSTTTTSNGAKNQETIATSVISLDLNELGKTEGRGRGATRSRAGGRSLQGMDEEGGGEGGGSKSNVPDQKHLETERRAHMLRKNQVCVCIGGGGGVKDYTHITHVRVHTHFHARAGLRLSSSPRPRPLTTQAPLS